MQDDLRAWAWALAGDAVRDVAKVCGKHARLCPWDSADLVPVEVRTATRPVLCARLRRSRYDAAHLVPKPWRGMKHEGVTGHDRRYRCSRSLIVFTVTDEDGEWCVTCGRLIRPAQHEMIVP